MDAKPIMTPSEAAEYARVCTKTLESWRKRGLRYAQIGAAIRFRREWVDEFIDAHTQGPDNDRADEILSST